VLLHSHVGLPQHDLVIQIRITVIPTIISYVVAVAIFHSFHVFISIFNFFSSELYVERHKDVSILYADVVNYTGMTSTLSVNTLVDTLNELFGRFDEASEKHHVSTFFAAMASLIKTS